jgi:hypothetical protein
MNSELAATTPVSGRRRQAPPPKLSSRLGQGHKPQLIAAAVALVGGLLVLAGGLQATVFAPSAVTVANLVSPRQPVVSTAIGVLGLEGTRLVVDASSGTASRPVFVGIGRAHDVDAYLARVNRLEVTGDDGGKLLTRRVGNQPSLPDPAGVDVWVVSARGQGSASLVWPDAPGQWRLVVATDGAAPAADELSFSWTGRERHTAAPALISIGLVLIVAGLITLVMLSSRARLADGDDDSLADADSLADEDSLADLDDRS